MDTDLFVRSRRPAPCFPSVIGRARPSRCTWKFFGAGAGRSRPDRTNMKQLRSDRLSRQPDITNDSSLIPSKNGIFSSEPWQSSAAGPIPEALH